MGAQLTPFVRNLFGSARRRKGASYGRAFPSWVARGRESAAVLTKASGVEVLEFRRPKENTLGYKIASPIKPARYFVEIRPSTLSGEEIKEGLIV